VHENPVRATRERIRIHHAQMPAHDAAALVCQADVARRIDDPALFAHCLAELIADAPNQREDDCGLNEQLVVDLPGGFCDSEREQQYRRGLAG
jgi:hypothetical protein